MRPFLYNSYFQDIIVFVHIYFYPDHLGHVYLTRGSIGKKPRVQHTQCRLHANNTVIKARWICAWGWSSAVLQICLGWSTVQDKYKTYVNIYLNGLKNTDHKYIPFCLRRLDAKPHVLISVALNVRGWLHPPLPLHALRTTLPTNGN